MKLFKRKKSYPHEVTKSNSIYNSEKHKASEKFKSK